MTSNSRPLVLVKGAGDLASGVAYRLFCCHFPVVMTELPQPLVVRRAVSFAQAVFDGETTVEGVCGRLAEGMTAISGILARAEIPVLVDPDGSLVRRLAPAVLVDGIMAKTNTGTSQQDARLVIALGPGFEAGRDCHAVVETQRGHTLGRLTWQGRALPDTGTPGLIEGNTALRVLRAPVDGFVQPLCAIGQTVAAGQIIARVVRGPHDRDGVAVEAAFPGVLRGLIHPSVRVHVGLKIGDLDPRARPENCFTISEKSLAVAGGVLEAILSSWIS